MTRKRYVKLLMADGFSRNEANRAAQGVIEVGHDYRSEYEMYLQDAIRLSDTTLSAWSGSMETFVADMEKIREAATKIGEAITAMFRAAVDAYREETNKA